MGSCGATGCLVKRPWWRARRARSTGYRLFAALLWSSGRRSGDQIVPNVIVMESLIIV
eukprot:SAG11_NODE_313_length_10878_cov_43.354578_11_plen_58_part_00